MSAPAPREESTQRAVLLFLKTEGEADAKQIAEFCGLTTMAVGRHLLKLQAAGLIESVSRRPSRGRPAAVYSLTAKGDGQFPRDYSGLARELLSQIVELDGPQKAKTLFVKRRLAMEARYRPRIQGKKLGERVEAVAEILTELGYMADGKKLGPGEYWLAEHNCAIRDVAECFPAACEEELILIRDLVGGEVDRITHLLVGDRHCCYRICAYIGQQGRSRKTAAGKRTKGG